ncbi:hypothetical protein JB92DRAFT_3010547 [Gautieria morchelliformis]|nr:hypothetical protein JB92DRAFT_3010547 [Gautieria morchelliformis]
MHPGSYIHSPNELRKYFYVPAMLVLIVLSTTCTCKFILFKTPSLSVLPPHPTRGVLLAPIITSFLTLDPYLRGSQLNNQ